MIFDNFEGLTLPPLKMLYNKNYLISESKDLISFIYNFFACKIFDVEKYEEIKQVCLGNPEVIANEYRYELVIEGAFGLKDYIYWYEKSGIHVKDGDLLTFVNLVLISFVEIGILIPVELGNLASNCYIIIEETVQLYNNQDLLFNRLFGFDSIADRYTPSVFKVVNHNNGKQNIGNAFLISHDGNSKLVTNFHVIDGADKIEVFAHDDTEDILISYREIQKIDELDLAIITLTQIPDAKHFTFNNELNILEDILTIGYPPVPTQRSAHPVYHKGEINSRIQKFGKMDGFLFSAKSNPGNSGSPVIDADGRVLGIVTRQLYLKGSELEGKLPYYVAIPSLVIETYLESLEEGY